jgi:nucleotide-binding universal stress UspA family protein
VTAKKVDLAQDTGQVIPAFAKTQNDSLIVLSAHGRSFVDRHIFGSTAEEIIHRSCGLALTVAPNVKILPAQTLNIRRILYATDCSLETAHGALAAVAWADTLRLNLMS